MHPLRPLGPLLVTLLRLLGPLAAALASAAVLDRMCRRKGLLPPGFRAPWRRLLAGLLLAGILWLGIFAPLGEIGLPSKLDVSTISTPQLFLLHVLLALSLLGWFVLGFAGTRPGPPAAASDSAVDFREPGARFALPGSEPCSAAGAGPGSAPPLGLELAPGPPPPAARPPAPPPSFLSQLALQLGFRAAHVGREIGLGLLLGAGAWLVVIVALIVLATVILAIGGENAMPKQPPAIVPFIASLPVMVRLAASLSAGFVEETFFRGFLQPRIGIALSTGMFVLAHLSYGQPFVLVGVSLLSLIYALLVRWRQTIWPAIAAHALFDGVQLLVIIPAVLRLLGHRGGAAGAKVLALLAPVAGWAGHHIW
ncbi:MAG TPA: CPBP family intramembrane glutamic endopeptidase [Thermoanaerobaculia bacterium]|nr:CPBP family intramembrane glutamic endopeptidase [Thermoanaerobaculia bacterium]